MDSSESVITDKNDYLNITIIDCIYRIKKLDEFKSVLNMYREGNFHKNKFDELRSNINQNITLIEEYIATTYTPVTIGYKFPGTIDHIQVAMYREIFNPRFESNIIQSAIDHLDIAIGRYKNARFKSVINTISPFYWIKRFSFWLTYSLANLFSIESSSKKFSLINVAMQIVTFLAAIAGIYGALVTYFGKSTLWFK